LTLPTAPVRRRFADWSIPVTEQNAKLRTVMTVRNHQMSLVRLLPLRRNRSIQDSVRPLDRREGRMCVERDREV